MSSSIGIILNSINNKSELLDEDYIKSNYSPFVINKSLSYFLDCVLHVHELDQLANMSKYEQYLYYYYAIPKGRRFQRWHKADKSKYLESIAEYYNISLLKSAKILKLLDKKQCESIVKLVDKGGKK